MKPGMRRFGLGASRAGHFVRAARRVLAGAAVLIAGACYGKSPQIAYEPFDYQAGSGTLFGRGPAGTRGYGFEGTYANSGSLQFNAGTTNLVYPAATSDLAPIGVCASLTGPSAAQGDTGIALSAPFGDSEGRVTRYVSWLQKTTTINLNATLRFYSSRGQTAQAGFGGGISGNPRFNLCGVASTVAPQVGVTYFMVWRMDFHDGPSGSNEVMRLYINPGRTEPEEPTIIATNVNYGDFQRMMIHWGDAQSFDEIRVGVSYADVVTLPLSAPMLVIR